MENKKNILLPFELINKILIMRPTHPIVNILRSYVDNHLDCYGAGNVIYCYDIIHFLHNNELNYKYKSYRRTNKRKYNYCINEIERKINSYNIFKTYYNNTDPYTFKTFESSPEWNVEVDI